MYLAHWRQENFRNLKLEYKQYVFKVLQSSFSKDLKRSHLYPLRVKLFFMLLKINSVFLQIFVINVKWMTIMKDIKQGESWKVGNEAFIWWSL